VSPAQDPEPGFPAPRGVLVYTPRFLVPKKKGNALATATHIRAQWKEGRPVFGIWAALACPFAVELMAGPGIGYLCVDQQHGVVDYSDAVNMFMAAHARGVAPITRVPANESWMIGKALDAGAQGVVVPLVNNREEAAAAVSACRYPPRGVRSFGPIRSALVSGARDTATLGDSVLCFVMVETREGLRNIEEIASTPGLDGIYVGPADLALGMGLAPDLDKTEPEHAAAIQTILEACRRNRIEAGIQCSSGKSGRSYAEKGFRLVTIAKDSSLLQAAARAEIRAANGQSAPGKEGYT
jgi:4-hydroxy-2-oxoheptanedioate aldolase